MPTARLQVSDVPETGFFLTASVSTDLFHQSFHSFPFSLICSAIEDRSLSCVHRVSCTSQMSYLRRVSQMSNKHVDTGYERNSRVWPLSSTGAGRLDRA